MVVRMIPVDWSRDVELWHAASPARPVDPHEDRLIAVIVDLPQRFCLSVHSTETDWPMPVIAHAPKPRTPAT
jgi:hypothetical protein